MGRHCDHCGDHLGFGHLVAAAFVPREVPHPTLVLLLVFKAASPESIFPTDWSPDGRSVVFHSYSRGNVRLLPIDPGAAPATIVESPLTDWLAAFSPDGRWVAYVSDESGTEEVYVREVAGTVRHRVSAAGGIQPRWRRDGRELFFLSGGDTLMSASVTAERDFTTSVAKPLFTACPRRSRGGSFMYRYDITPYAERSLWICESTDRVATIAVHALAALSSGRD